MLSSSGIIRVDNQGGCFREAADVGHVHHQIVEHRTSNRHLSIIIQFARKHSNRLYLNCVWLMHIIFNDDTCILINRPYVNFNTLFQRNCSFRVFHPLLGGRRTTGVFIPLLCRRTDAEHFSYKNNHFNPNIVDISSALFI